MPEYPWRGTPKISWLSACGAFWYHKNCLVLCSVCWLQLHQSIQTYSDSCEVCACTMTPCTKPLGLLHPLPMATQSWHMLSVDFITDLPPTLGHSSIMVVVDILTNMAHFIPYHHCPRDCLSIYRKHLPSSWFSQVYHLRLWSIFHFPFLERPLKTVRNQTSSLICASPTKW